MERIDGRKPNQLRSIKLTNDFIKFPEGSVLIEVGNTKVICNATIEEKVPPFLKGGGKGWVTAEYSMLPRATQVRTARESAKGKVTGRTQEIQRLIGRALRSVVDLRALGERTVWIDCDVIQADGGTRTASITGAFVAMVNAFKKLKENGTLQVIPVTDYLAAVSLGIVENEILLDLCYEEDSKAQVDMNVVMTKGGKFVELQGTAEEAPFTYEELEQILAVAKKGIEEITRIQADAVGGLDF